MATVVVKNFINTIDPEEQKQRNGPSIALLQGWLSEAQKPRTPEEEAEAERDLEELMRNLSYARNGTTVEIGREQE